MMYSTLQMPFVKNGENTSPIRASKSPEQKCEEGGGGYRLGLRGEINDDLSDGGRLSWDWNDNNNNSRTRSLVNSMRQSVGVAEQKIRRFFNDVLFYNLTLTAAYFTFSMALVILLTILIFQISQNRNRFVIPSSSMENTTAIDDLADLCQSHKVSHSSPQPFQMENVTKIGESHCHVGYQDCLDKVHLLQEEIVRIREQFEKNVTRKQENVQKLAKAISTFRNEHVCLSKTFCEVFAGGLVGALASIVFYLKIFKSR